VSASGDSSHGVDIEKPQERCSVLGLIVAALVFAPSPVEGFGTSRSGFCRGVADAR
tara:strand:+ start:1979 stop:2146 length:168 start_codon:yes stop_codon:yes gene_type:complete